MSTRSDPEVLCGSRKDSLNRQASRAAITGAFEALGECSRKESVDMVWTRFYAHRTRSWVNRNLDKIRAEAALEIVPDQSVHITYADPTGNTAVHRAMSPGCNCRHCTHDVDCACAACSINSKKNGPETVSAKTRLEAA